ncbi:3-hydroxyacyl-CoA dehydrogenase NAD-binding domain-containing protein [Brevundimonas sp.]|uniref:3-hydroxyacyl-CoA dehydrogenase NAD-binding domain-containing protein n=1 Tax=Brevundimonas sp. TaxID=1871086 RepID=UPI003B004323
MNFATSDVIVVVGAGAMGAGIAQVAAVAGHRVRVIDQSEASLVSGREAIQASLASQVKRGALSEEEVAAIEARLSFTIDIAAAEGASLAIEAIIERSDAKLAVFAALANVMSPEAVIASNTSSLSIADLAQGSPSPARFVGLHFFNPAPVMKLVEIVPAPAVPTATTEALADLMRRWGKKPVLVRDVPGFIVNRVARPYYGEGFRALGEGVPAATIDHALTAAGGFRMGPLTLADMIGHDVNYTVARSVFDAYHGKTRFRPEPSQQALFEAGRLGRKSGSGVYNYADPLPRPDLRRAGPRPEQISISSRPGRLAVITALAAAAGLRVVEDATLPDEAMSLDGAVVVFGDGRLLRDRSEISILLDPPRDLDIWPVWVATAANPTLEYALAGLAGVVERAVLLVPDRPGQIVLRSLAQLANAAADAVLDDVATPAGIDEAMVFGANHPQGPLAWALTYGPDRVRTALSNISEATGEPLYQPSEWFSRQLAPEESVAA